MLKVHRLTVAFVGLVWLALPFAAFGVPALGKPRTVQQPNGNHLQVVQKGDEWSNHVENGRGYAISRGSDGVWRYVRGYDSKRKPLLDATLAHKSPPPGLQKHLSPPSSRPKGAPNAGIKGAGSALVGPTGSMSAPVLFILAEFSDTAGSTNESNWADFTNNKVPDYFSATSHGNAILSPANETFGTADDGVVGWVNVGVAHPDTYGTVDNRNRNLAADAIIAADPFIDFSTYDLDSDGFVDGDELAIVVIVAGYETAYGGTDFSIHPAVWGHQWGWSTNRPAVDGVEINSYAQFGERHGWDVYGNVEDHQATMGIMVHELGHLVFDLPDLYDTDGSSAGIGSFGLMGSGSWGWTEADLYNNDFEGTTPVNACAWTKVQLQWAAAPEGDETETIIASGISDPDSLPGGVVFRASTYGAATEYFLVENRQNVGYDAGLEGLLSSAWFVDFGGLAIWHIDDTQTDNTNDSNRWVDLEEADGTDMENVDYGRGHPTALWYAGNAAVFDDTTNPSSDLNDGSPSGVDIYNI
jgi:M6 family metalloprotease-like protein